jgi:uncharacterized protein
MVSYVEFRSGVNVLRGMLHLPSGPGRFACVVFLHGFTGNSKEDHFLFVKLARQLEKAGIAALRFDFAGSGESDGEFDQMTATGETDDAAAALDFLLAHPRLDRARVGVCGLSLGGCVAALLAGRRGDDLAAAVLLSAVSDFGNIIINLSGEKKEQLTRLGYVDWDGLATRQAFFEDARGIHAAEKLAAFPRPVLIVHGEKDAVVPPAQAEKFRSARAAALTPTELVMIPDADHTYRTVVLTQKVCDLVTAFFTKTLK